ncbi:uracil-DNA glycosylase family protein [bacterium]|nr:uracil-DNA glycosylase family protein [bacterium]
MSARLEEVLREARACRVCEAHLPLGPRPVLRASATARVLLVGQAPGTRVHATGIPWNDPSGDRLREWLCIDKADFYDESKLAIIPMGLCYPGNAERGDMPPRPECAPLWMPRLLPLLQGRRLTLLIGQYAIGYFLGRRAEKSLTETVRNWEEYQPDYFPLPHPSPRNILWRRNNPWFEEEIVPELRRRFASAFSN